MPIAILPAAGRSQRMGRSKLLLPFGRSTVVGSLVAALRAAGVARIVLVVGHASGEIGGWAAGHGITVAVNPKPERGMLSSVLEGLEALGGAEAAAAELTASDDVLLVSPADLPAIRAETVRRLVCTTLPTTASLAVPLHSGRRGHPLVVTGRRVPEIPTLDAQVGLRQLLERHADEVFEVEVDDPGVLLDVDTPEAYRRLVQTAGPSPD